MSRVQSTLVATLLACGATTPLAATKTLTGDELKTLIVGKTIYVEYPAEGRKFRNYFDASGVSYRHEDGKTKELKYEIKADGSHCVKFLFMENCAVVNDNGDGTYSRVPSDTSQTVKWYKIVNGKNFE